MDGLFFYWITWMVLIVMLFFVPASQPVRYPLLIHLLMVLILTAYEIHLYSFTINAAGVYGFFICCYCLRNQALKEGLYFWGSTISIAIGYACFHMFSLLDPVWLIVDSWLQQAILMNYVVLLMFRDWKLRIFSIIIGAVLGECLYAGVLLNNALYIKAFSLQALDALTWCLLINISYSGFEIMSKQFQAQARFLQKERQS